MEFGKRHDTTVTTDFCPRQLVTDLLYGEGTEKLGRWVLALNHALLRCIKYKEWKC